MKKIAIIGAGLSGLAAAWHLSEKSRDAEITVFDPKPIGSSTSGMAAGLLHPFAGAHAKRNWRADEGMQASLELFAVAAQALGKPVAFNQGLLRLATSAAQREDFALCQQRYPGQVHWRTAEEHVAGVLPLPAIFIDGGVLVDCPNYLKGLWKALANKGVAKVQAEISSLRELEGYELVIAATGAATTRLPELQALPLHCVKGQLLELKWPNQFPPLPFPLNSQSYLLMSPGGGSCIAGATYEKKYTTAEADVETAVQEILPKVRAFFPHLDRSHVIECRAGMRSTSPDHLPFLKQISKNAWVIAGMGSKGLLYHALYAKELSFLCVKKGH